MIGFCPAIFLSYKNIIRHIIIIIITTTFDISVPITSEMIATPLPCNITEYKTLAICRVIFIWGSNILSLQVNFIWWERGQNVSFDIEGCRPLV